MSDNQLTKEQFADAISKGLGRAMMHVKRHGLDDVADIVLDACIHNKAYDGQCEDRRTDWLYAMFNNSPQYNTFRETILSALKKENDWYETAQLCELAKEMALDGDEYARIQFLATEPFHARFSSKFRKYTTGRKHRPPRN